MKLMRKLTFLVGAGVGFVLGSKVGTEPYQRLESAVRNVAGRPEVQDAVDRAKDTAKTQVTTATDKLTSSNGRSTDESGPATANDTPVQSYADPQDLQFSKAAADKEEILDGLLAQGVAPEKLDDAEQELRQKNAIKEPPAGNRPAGA
jgi:predicted Fe-Mo cluster-binding NifX family protein